MHLTSSIDIEAPLDRVWAILADLAAYPEWNPFTTRVEGTLAVGEKLRLQVILGGKPQERTHIVSRVEPNVALCWTIRTKQPWLIRGERCKTLEALPGGRTRYKNDEHVQGLLSTPIAWGYGPQVQEGLDATGRALQARAER